MIRVRKGEPLDFIKNPFSQLASETHTCDRREPGSYGSAKKRNDRHQEHQAARLQNIGQIPGRNSDIDDFCHQERNPDFDQRLNNDQGGRNQRGPPVFIQIGNKVLNHYSSSFRFFCSWSSLKTSKKDLSLNSSDEIFAFIRIRYPLKASRSSGEKPLKSCRFTDSNDARHSA